jgi:hypothetical protein
LTFFTKDLYQNECPHTVKGVFMKTLSFDEMKRVSGAGHFGDVRDANMGKSNKNTGSNNKVTPGITIIWGKMLQTAIMVLLAA